MEQKADEMSGDDAKRRARGGGGGEATGEESSAWVREESGQSEAAAGEWEPGQVAEFGPDADAQQPAGCDASSAPLLSLKRYLRRSSSSSCSSSESLSSSQQSNIVDCAGFVLNCLFCRFYDLFLMLPDSCERAANHCCPGYKHVLSTMETAAGGQDDAWTDWDCGLFSSCQDASECLELAMEVSELCYR